MAAKMGMVEPASPTCDRVTIASTITTWRMRRSALSRVLQHDAELGFDLPLNRALKSAEARRAGECFELRMPLLFGKKESGLGIASFGCLVADVKCDRRAREAGSSSGRQRVVDQ